MLYYCITSFHIHRFTKRATGAEKVPVIYLILAAMLAAPQIQGQPANQNEASKPQIFRFDPIEPDPDKRGKQSFKEFWFDTNHGPQWPLEPLGKSGVSADDENPRHTFAGQRLTEPPQLILGARNVSPTRVKIGEKELTQKEVEQMLKEVQDSLLKEIKEKEKEIAENNNKAFNLSLKICSAALALCIIVFIVLSRRERSRHRRAMAEIHRRFGVK